MQIKYTLSNLCLVVAFLFNPEFGATFIPFLQCLLQLEIEIETLIPESQDSLGKEFSNALVVKSDLN